MWGGVLLGKDPRRTGDVIRRSVIGRLLASGSDVTDYGVISTPALFRESLRLGKPAVMITASHNEPEWNGIKFISNGRMIDEGQLSFILRGDGGSHEPGERMVRPRSRPRYDDDLLDTFGERSADG